MQEKLTREGTTNSHGAALACAEFNGERIVEHHMERMGGREQLLEQMYSAMATKRDETVDLALRSYGAPLPPLCPWQRRSCLSAASAGSSPTLGACCLMRSLFDMAGSCLQERNVERLSVQWRSCLVQTFC